MSQRKLNEIRKHQAYHSQALSVVQASETLLRQGDQLWQPEPVLQLHHHLDSPLLVAHRPNVTSVNVVKANEIEAK
jgi:hypothetical protein